MSPSISRFLHRFGWHILFWALYFIGWTSFATYTYQQAVWLSLAITLAWFLGQATMIYLAIYVWIPRFLKPGRIWVFIFMLIVSIFIAAIFTSTGMYGLQKLAASSQTLPFSNLFGYVCLGNTYWIIMAVGLAVLRDRLRNDRRNQRLEKEHAENELRFLKSQMNPHFLFNAINSIYVLIRKDPGLAEHTLARFSDMLRYQLYDCATDFIPIEKEITYLENYMRLEQLRKGSMLSLDYNTEETVGHFSIAPLLLMPLVENAFKFVSSFTDRDNQVRIHLHFCDGQFIFEIGNTVDGPRTTAVGGIGLENVRRRLELLYPSRHTLTVDSNSEFYNVSLKLQVT
jgi:two-component system LytT family sensor kinase